MKEIKAIVAAYDKIDKSQTAAALATVVRVEGSSYRRTGARMLVMDDGVWIGGISGGCLEGDALKRARLAIANEKPSLVTYDTTDDDAYQIGVGLGCNGIIDVLFAPLDYADKQNPVEILKTAMSEPRQPQVLITFTSATGIPGIQAGAAILYRGNGSLSVIGDAKLRRELEETIATQFESGKSISFSAENDKKSLSAFVEILLPDIHLVLMGHQYDIYPLSRLARELGWPVTMVSNPLKINSRLLETVDNVLDYNQTAAISFDTYTAVMLMSHDFKTDKRNLPVALKTQAFYIGMLGPRSRSERIFNELDKEGVMLTDADKERIFAPAGLDIGALSPEEIALAILAEIRAVYARRSGGFLRLRQAAIHERG